MLRHFLQIADLSAKEIELIIKNAIAQKKYYKKNHKYQKQILKDKTVILIFDKPSTRTRLSFQFGVNLMGGNSVLINKAETQSGRGEELKDSVRVMSRYSQMIMIRTFGQEIVEEMVKYSSVPIINGLTNEHHPCQVMADLMTWQEKLSAKHSIKKDDKLSFIGKTVGWVGDANNVCKSWAQAANLLGFNLRISTPEKFNFTQEVWQKLNKSKNNKVSFVKDPKQAVENVDLVLTDAWVSMGFENERGDIEKEFKPWQVNKKLMSLAKPNAIFMHCLPAYRDLEVTDDVIESSQSVVWDEAENRAFAQNAIMEFLLKNNK